MSSDKPIYFLNIFGIPEHRVVISCPYIFSKRLPGPGGGPDGPVLVPGGSGQIDQLMFSTYFRYQNSGLSFPALKFSLASSLGQKVVQMDLFCSLEYPDR